MKVFQKEFVLEPLDQNWEDLLALLIGLALQLKWI